jgi:single-strand DNA-binding protein
VSLPQTIVVGTLTADPELRFTPAGAAVANFTIASNERKYNRQTQQFEDGAATFLRCNIWREYAENVAESLTRGTQVVAIGNLKQREFETREGDKRQVMELEVTDIGPSLRFATAKLQKVSRSGGNGGGRAQAKQDDDPWGAAPAADDPDAAWG